MCSSSSGDVCQTFQDAHRNVGVGGGWGKREEQLGVVRITDEENPCDVFAEPNDLVYSENRSGPNTEP